MVGKALLLCLVAVAGGCSRDLTVKVRFDAVSGLRQGAPVVLDGGPIGTVEEVRYTPEGRFEVRAKIEEAFRAAVTDRARFLVDEGEGGEKRLEVVALENGGTPLADGAVVEGSSRVGVVGESIRREMDRFLQGLTQVPDAEAVREFQAELRRFSEQLRGAGREARERMKKEVIPDLERRWEELKRWLREHDRSDEIDPVERQLRELQRT
jgi:ABC-type transporter Mla subunit MlaD